MTEITKENAYFFAIETLNLGNRRKIFEATGLKGSFEDFPAFSDDEFKILETAMINEYLSMGKFSNYVFNEILTKDDFNDLKERYKKSKKNFFSDPGLDNLNWIHRNEDDEALIHFTFYKLATHFKMVTNQDNTNDWVKTTKLFVYDLEIRQLEEKVWVILKFPKIKPEKGSKTYSFLPEWENVQKWLGKKFNCSMQAFDLKLFYENFHDQDDLVKISFDVENYEDENQQLRATNFSIKVNQTADFELSRIYSSIDFHLSHSFREYLTSLYNSHCQKQKIPANSDTIEFFQVTERLMRTEMIFQAIQERCVYLIGGIRYKYKLRSGRECTNNYSIEKMPNQIGGILRSAREGNAYFDRVFKEIKEYFDSAKT